MSTAWSELHEPDLREPALDIDEHDTPVLARLAPATGADAADERIAETESDLDTELDTGSDTGSGAETETETETQPIGAAALLVAASGIHGSGVFAARGHEPDEVIERCPVLVLDHEDAVAIADTVLGDYVYEWHDGAALALGFGSLYNHSRASNARYEMDYDNDEIHVVAINRIAEGDEITINYNGDPAITTPVWFESDADTEPESGFTS